MIKRLVESPADCDPESVRTLIWGGAPMYVEDIRKALDRFGPRLAQIYGQGESPMTITTLSREDPPGEVGEIMCRGDVVMQGYWQNEEATSASLAGGWLRTGDVGAFDEEGYLTLKDRSKDLIISGGSNIYPREVEEVLLQDSRVREVSVIGRPDGQWGEVVIAYIVGDAAPAELDRLCLSRIARFKRPKQYVFVDALPKNNYGKILKTELRRLDAGRRERANG
jgi:long-chain acyl-CoA synthetase